MLIFGVIAMLALGQGPAQQANAGRAAYQANCASCHLPDLSGEGDAAPLRGPAFQTAWGTRTPQELLSFIQLTMPPQRPGALSAQEYNDIVAFILQQNSATAAPPAAGQGGGGGGGGRGGGRGGAPAGPKGITVAGEVKNFTRVTDAMLRNPDPGDWLMIRRDYHATSYSPLNQINRDNVKDLQLKWVWSMTEGGRTQASPIVHNGIMYLNNAGNVIQALDGKTGELIWENNYGTNAAGDAMRGIAIYDDKITVSTSNARSSAFD